MCVIEDKTAVGCCIVSQCFKKSRLFQGPGSVIEHDMASLNFQTAMQNKEAKLTSVVRFENEIVSYHALQLNRAKRSIF